MKIIDFKKKGNVVRFYLGADGCKDYSGDDWNDTPYEHNAEKVRDDYITGYRDVIFPFDYSVLEPCDGVTNSDWCKDDMKARKVPCILAVENSDEVLFSDNFNTMSMDSRAIRFYFGDKMEPADALTVFELKER